MGGSKGGRTIESFFARREGMDKRRRVRFWNLGQVRKRVSESYG